MTISHASRIILEVHLDLLKSVALTRLKSALIDPRAMYTDLTEEEATITSSRASFLFKFLISLNSQTAKEWFQAIEMVPSSIEGSYKPQQFESLCEYVYERFQEKKDLNFGSEFGLDENELIGSIMCYVWKSGNVNNLDFTLFCNYLKLDEATYNMVKRAICAKTKEHDKMCERLQDSMCSGVDLYVLLTMANAEAVKWPFTMDWSWVTVNEEPLTVEDLAEYSNTLYEEAEKAVADIVEPEKTELNTMMRTLRITFEQAEKKLKETMSDLEKLNDQDFVELIEEHVVTMENRREIIKNHIPASIKQQRNYSELEIVAIQQQIDDIREETTILRRPAPSAPPTQTFQQRLELQRDQPCLARRTNSNFFQLARVVNKQLANRYTVEFLEDGSFVGLDVSDIANTEVPPFDPCIGNSLNRFIGMRVVALIDYHGRGTKWMSGTIGATGGLHGDSFLVFFDRNIYSYINAVYQSESKEAREFVQSKQGKPKNPVEWKDWMKPRIEAIKMFPLCEQAFSITGNELERRRVYELVTENHEINTFLYRYFDKFPDWPLVRMRRPVANTIPQRINMADKKAGFVIDVDRAMCLLRFPKHGEPGDDCYAHPCLDEAHDHEDEWIYRGSTRFNTMNLDRIDNSNLSARQKTRNQAYYAEETKKTNTARKSGLPTNGYLAVQSAHNMINKDQLKNRNMIANKFETILVKCDLPVPMYTPHSSCKKTCLGGLEKSAYDPCFKEISPLAVPLLCGWKRNLYHLSTRLKVNRLGKQAVTYTSPCGRTFRSMAEIGKYLRECDSQLTMDLFTFTPTIDPLRAIKADKSAVIMEDYTQGQELFPIPAINTLDDEQPPKIQYCSRKYPLDDRVNISTITKEFCSGCTCEDDCSDPTRCECQLLTTSGVNRLAFNIRPEQHGYKYRYLEMKTISGIYECNENCNCNRNSCFNRVVQNEIKYPLQLFKTAGCGWGVRTVCDIPRGAFIANYVGALMTDEIAEDKGQNDDQYFADLDLIDVVEMQKIQAQARFGHLDLGNSDEEEDDSQCVPGANDNDECDDEELPAKRLKSKTNSQEREQEKRKLNRSKLRQRDRSEEQEHMFKWADYFGNSEHLFVLDAKYKGNIGRFLNHSCDPNVYVAQIFVDTHDLRLPWVAFFSTRDIRAGEELCWNYSYHIDENREEELQVICHCGSKFCCGRLL